MADVVVTVPQDYWTRWIAEGDAVGDPATGEEWAFYFSTRPMPHLRVPGGWPRIQPGERVYVIAYGRVRGYAPLSSLQRDPPALGRRGGAVAVTIPEEIAGFPGWRYRWWDVAAEVPFPAWRREGVGKAPPVAQARLFG